MDSHVRAWEPLLDRFIFQAVMQTVKLVQGFSYLAEWENKVQVYHGSLTRRRILLVFPWINISQDHYPGFID